jgi:hypothetical protein
MLHRRTTPGGSLKHCRNNGTYFNKLLAKGDTVEITKNGESHIQRIREFKENKQIFMVPVNDAHPAKEQDALHISWSKKPSTIMPFAPRKVVVDLLGGVHPAND